MSKSLRKRLSFAPLNTTPTPDWDTYELFALPTKDQLAGVLFLQPKEMLYAIPYEIRRISDKATGRSKPIICDLCKTWQSGSRAGSITFRTDRRSLNSISLLCCFDLQCSQHVRAVTDAAKLSRAHLREDLTKSQRIQRLQENITALTDRLQLAPLSA